MENEEQDNKPPPWLSRLRHLPAGLKLRSGAGSIPAWADYLLGFFSEVFPNRNVNASDVRFELTTSVPQESRSRVRRHGLHGALGNGARRGEESGGCARICFLWHVLWWGERGKSDCGREERYPDDSRGESFANSPESIVCLRNGVLLSREGASEGSWPPSLIYPIKLNLERIVAVAAERLVTLEKQKLCRCLTEDTLTVNFEAKGTLSVVFGVVLCDMYANQELAEVQFMYGKADGNAVLARRLYQERYPD
ncbi:hypothetical protein ANN_18165 [Periplaneta americana]|uniref:Uncharacterized protein n=1 Tax=Periplaneta americana TaxID=6978 RepID=A0ABQ8SN03_PERAM|nr:hypothetical protein ANN_18165 [Periplaneta americana]